MSDKAVRIIQTDLRRQVEKLGFVQELCRAASQTGGAVEVKRFTKRLEYSLAEACKLVVDTGSYGPWGEDYFLKS